jgi:hypothetical protein
MRITRPTKSSGTSLPLFQYAQLTVEGCSFVEGVQFLCNAKLETNRFELAQHARFEQILRTNWSVMSMGVSERYQRVSEGTVQQSTHGNGEK